jgi:hypothetical protein
MSDASGPLQSLASGRSGTHVDFVSGKVQHDLDGGSKPWFYSNTTLDASETHALVDARSTHSRPQGGKSFR